MTRFRALGALILLLAGAWVVYAQEQQRLLNILILDRFQLGTSVDFIMEGTGNDDLDITFASVNPSANVTYTLPSDDGDSGEQLQTDGSGGLTWESAGSLRAFKDIGAEVDPRESLALVLGARTYHFTYKPGASRSTGDLTNDYVGVMGDEAPWAMHHGDEVFDPISAFGRAVGAIQAQQAEIDALTAELAALRSK